MLNPDSQSVLDHTRQLRLEGRLQEAVQSLNQILRQHMNEASVVVEALYLLILVNDVGQIKILYEALKAIPGWQKIMTLECGIRVSQALGQDPEIVLAYKEMVSVSRWVSVFREKKEDICAPMTVTGMSLTVSSGVTYYKFMGACAFCDRDVTVDVPMTLFQEKNFICRECLGRNSLSGRHMVTATAAMLLAAGCSEVPSNSFNPSPEFFPPSKDSRVLWPKI